MPTVRTRRLLLIAALAVTAGAVYWAASLDQATQEDAVVAPARTRAPAGNAAGAQRGGPAAGKQRLDLTRLQREPAAEPSADLFGRAPASIAPPPAPRADAAAAAQLPPAPPEPPPLPFKYLGQLAESDRKLVFLAAGDRNLVVGAGDVIDDVYRVDDIGADALSLTYLPMNIQQTLSTGAAP